MERDTRVWLERMVMGMSLCPFARASMPGLRVHVTRGRAWRILLATSQGTIQPKRRGFKVHSMTWRAAL